MALLMVLLMMSLMAIVAVNINDHWQRSLARPVSAGSAEGEMAAVGRGDLRPTAVAAGRRAAQGLGSLWGGVQYAYRRGEVAIRLRRVDACFNVNALIRAAGSTEVGDSEGLPNKERRIFMLLLNNLGIADAQAGAIADAIVARAYGEGYLMGISANCGSWPVSIVSYTCASRRSFVRRRMLNCRSTRTPWMRPGCRCCGRC